MCTPELSTLRSILSVERELGIFSIFILSRIYRFNTSAYRKVNQNENQTQNQGMDERIR
jgi:hypothetical protein